jgi:hypothetical protein
MKLDDSSPPRCETNPRSTRRTFLTQTGIAAGVALAGTLVGRQGALRADPLRAAPAGCGVAMPGIVVDSRSKLPTYLAARGVSDPAVLSVAEQLWGLTLMAEHAELFSSMMPAPELAPYRARLGAFAQQFRQRFTATTQVCLDRTSYVAFNEASMELLTGIAALKLELADLQRQGRIHTLVYTTFFEHTAHEAHRIMERLSQLSKGQVAQDPEDVRTFWSDMMGNHAGIIRQLLDPSEAALIAKCNEFAARFADLHGRAGAYAQLKQAADDFVAFAQAAQQGVDQGTVQSIINPTLADHVLREHIKFQDEAARLT